MQFQNVLLVVHITKCLDLEINGEVSFDLRIFNLDLNNNNNDFRQIQTELETKMKRDTDKRIALKVVRAEGSVSNVTAAPMVECVYQYPEKEQVNALLSNMMNHLTKIFVGAHGFMQKEDSRRKQETRFSRVINKRDTEFFESTYNNMTEEYRIFYKSTAERVDRSGRDPCQHQDEIKGIWKELLEKSLVCLRRAALHCVEEYLRVQHRTTDIATSTKLKQFLMSELRKARSSQLDVLCDQFQLCFNELL